ncbi:hypothetical protein [Shewanella woodyi]|uniref:hypothetical protein n=1 Tax=Shewanella woodyi TaxID=60961 RepID=UPI0007EB438D|nr:hypothetical protein [Shewanella woodyi]
MLKKSYSAALLTTLLISTSSMAGALNVEPNKGGAAERATDTQLSNGNTQSVADIDIKAVLSPTLNLRPLVGVRRPQL